MIERTLSSEFIYSGRILDVRVDTVEGPNGTTTREIVDHADAVCIIPFDPPDQVFLIRQFRKPIESFLIEAPAGCMDDGESPLDAAKRELKEETGFDATSIEWVRTAVMAPGFCNEHIHIFIAEGLTPGETRFDADETMTLLPMTLSDAMTMINHGEIIDAKTIIGLNSLNNRCRGQ